MSAYTHEITIPGTQFRCYVNADTMDLDKLVMKIWGRTVRDRKRNTPPSVRALEPGEDVPLTTNAMRASVRDGVSRDGLSVNHMGFYAPNRAGHYHRP